MSLILIGLSLVAAPPSAGGQSRPAAYEALVKCRQVAEGDRLRCYDAAMSTMESSVANGAIVIVDRQELSRARRSLFGLRLPQIPILSAGEDKDEREVEATIRSVRPIERGRWELTLTDGAVWHTSEEDTRSIDPRAGQLVRIKRGTLGSYILTWPNGRPQRARRVA